MSKNTNVAESIHAEAKKSLAFVNGLKESALTNNVFDSAAAEDFVSGAINQSSAKIPENLAVIFDEVGNDNKAIICRAVLDGVSTFETQHGQAVTGDLLRYAMHLGYATSDDAKRKYRGVLDNVAGEVYQPNRAVVAIQNAISMAVPWLGYLPADIGSGKAVLAIASHYSGSAQGGYTVGGLMDGHYSGQPFMQASRVHLSNGGPIGTHTGKITHIQSTIDTCDQAAGDTKLVRGRSVVYVNGRVAAREVDDTSGSGNSNITGTVIVAGTSYAIAGAINTDTGVFSLTSTPALALNIPPIVEGFLDYERSPDLIPILATDVKPYHIYASMFYGKTSQTIDSQTRMANELQLDPYSENMIAVQRQLDNERHYDALRKAKRLAVNNQATFDFNWAVQGLAKTRSQIWQDFGATLGIVDQQMILDTLNHGVSHVYCGKAFKAQCESLPNEIFTPSGIRGAAGIYRVGRLFGKYEVYYLPAHPAMPLLTESSTAFQLLCIGQATDSARNPIVVGDAVPTTLIQLAPGANFSQGMGYFGKRFTAVNPHPQSSLGCALINVTNN